MKKDIHVDAIPGSLAKAYRHAGLLQQRREYLQHTRFSMNIRAMGGLVAGLHNANGRTAGGNNSPLLKKRHNRFSVFAQPHLNLKLNHDYETRKK